MDIDYGLRTAMDKRKRDRESSPQPSEHIGELHRENDITPNGDLRTTYKTSVPDWEETFDVIGKQIGECLESYHSDKEHIVSVTITAGEPTEIVCIHVRGE